MEDDEDGSHLVALGELVSKHDAFDMTLVADVLQHCDHDPKRAYEMLSEMVIPADTDNQVVRDAAEGKSEGAPAPKHVHTAEGVQNAVMEDREIAPEYADFFRHALPTGALTRPTSPHRPTSPPPSRATSEPASSPARQAPLQGAWAQNSIGRRYRVDEMCRKYEWVSRSFVKSLFENYGDCVDLVESAILSRFPVDEPQAFGGGRHPISSETGQALTNNLANSHRSGEQSSSHHRAIAENLRQQAVNEIHKDALRPDKVLASSKEMLELRNQLWETRNARARMQQLANQTRKPAHAASAKEKDDELRRLSELFLSRMRQSVEYKNGVIDLHGLTREESLQLVTWKLEDSGGRRFRVITGRGTHSHNGLAMLRPSLEKFLRSKGISFSTPADGIMSVTP